MMYELEILKTFPNYFIYGNRKPFKGTVSEFQVTLDAKMAMPDSQRYLWNLYLINNVEDIVVFLGGSLGISLTVPLIA